MKKKRRVRVMKAVPFFKVGKSYELDENGGVPNWKYGWKADLSAGAVKMLEAYGYIEEVGDE